jgi:hypothetical protein
MGLRAEHGECAGAVDATGTASGGASGRIFSIGEIGGGLWWVWGGGGKTVETTEITEGTETTT